MTVLHRPPVQDPDPINPAIPPLEPDRGPIDPMPPEPIDEPVIEPIARRAAG